MAECVEERLAIMLPDYWSGHLKEADRLAVEAHLRQCKPCRKSLTAMHLLAGDRTRHGEDGDSGHITTTEFSAYHADPASLSKEALGRIRDHVRACADCSSDLEFMVKLEASLREAVSTHTAQGSAGTRIIDRLRPFFSRPAIAFPLLIALVSAAAWWLRPAPPEGTSRPAQTARILLKELRRAGGEPTSVPRTSNTETLRLDLPHYTLSEMSYAAMISKPSQAQPLGIAIQLQLEDTGIVHADLDPRSLSDGEFDLMLLEISRTVPPETTFSSFAFRLVTRDAAR